ncbi:hypothetical protein OCK74_21765 [Chitinophagaceae bacterium LB-8]|uniref:EthD domain-containing protein n=1 Tax=Paraflavisolibacter caeni TaxID=2982496 RepID=A0A9X2XY70_9BACT|nr:hypothetical protein [Paraflavisolibacter caeni]MCU7551764.1 hypothetical protein [Paraflavisolibacter caeni]
MKEKQFTLVKITLFLLLLISTTHLLAQQTPKNPDETFTIENYYKVKWGYADEFISLWKKNHYPLLKKAIEKGDIVSIVASRPRLHDSEESRWDFRVAIVFKNSALAYDDNLLTPYKKAIYPDEEKLKKEEQHRFELLLAHWDVEVKKENID